MQRVAVIKADSYDQQVVDQAMIEIMTEFGGVI